MCDTKIKQRGACADCGARLGKSNKTGYCRRHASTRLAQSPEYQAAHREGLRRHYANPDNMARARATLAANGRTEHAKARRSEAAKRDRLWEKGQAAQGKGSDARMRAGQSAANTRLAWCPPEFRRYYRFLVRTKRLLKADAIVMVQEAVARKQALEAQKAARMDAPDLCARVPRHPIKMRAEDIPSEMERLAQQWKEQGRAAA